MTEFIKANKKLSLSLVLSILFFLRKGIHYSTIGNFMPLFIIIGLIVFLVISILLGKKIFILSARIWAIILIIWSLIRLLISIIHITVKPFEGSLHLAQQFSAYTLILSVLMLVLGIIMFRSLSKKRIKGWL